MIMSKLLRWVLLVFGTVIIVAAELLFRGNLSNDTLSMNIIVSLVAWGTLFAGIGFPWIDLNDKAQRRVGALGLFWFFSSLFALCSVIWMIVGAQLDLSFKLQLIVHLVLLFVLIMGLAMARKSSEKVCEIYKKEVEGKKGVTEIRQALASLKESIFTAKDIPDEIVDRISKMCEETRYVSPSNNEEAFSIENEIVKLAREMETAFFDYIMNEDSIKQKLSRCERLLINRKQIHSL